jgi:hypothetical protein
MSANEKLGFITLSYPFWHSIDCVLGNQAKSYDFCYLDGIFERIKSIVIQIIHAIN